MSKTASVALAGLLGLVWLAAYLLIAFDGEHRFLSEIGYVSAATVATAIITFFGILGLGREETRSGFSDERLRSAIAASSTMTYLVLIGTAGLFTTGGQLPPISQMLLTSFTTTVGVIIAFYFGASAYVAGKTKSKPPESDA